MAASAKSVRGSAVYKKKDGTLSIAKDQKSLLWIPLQYKDGASGVTIVITHITSKPS